MWMIGLSNNKAEVDITRLVRGKITIVGSFGAKARIDAPEIIRLIERGILSLESITKVYTLDEIATAYEDLRARRITGKAIVKI